MKTGCLSYGSKDNGWLKMKGICKENGCMVFHHQ